MAVIDTNILISALLSKKEVSIPFYKIIKEKSNVCLVMGSTKPFPMGPFIVTARQMINLLEEDENNE